jgi:hypothetical protein
VPFPSRSGLARKRAALRGLAPAGDTCGSPVVQEKQRPDQHPTEYHANQNKGEREHKLFKEKSQGGAHTRVDETLDRDGDGQINVVCTDILAQGHANLGVA